MLWFVEKADKSLNPLVLMYELGWISVDRGMPPEGHEVLIRGKTDTYFAKRIDGQWVEYYTRDVFNDEDIFEWCNMETAPEGFEYGTPRKY